MGFPHRPHRLRWCDLFCNFAARQFETFLKLSSVASKHAASPFEILKAEARSLQVTQSRFSVWQTGQGYRVGVNFRLACILPATHNQLMHAMNGNIPILRLARTDVHIHARIVLPLADLLEPPTQTVYGRDLLLSLRPPADSSCNLIGLISQTTPPPSFMSSAQPPNRRTRQRPARLNAEGVRIYHRHNKHKKNSAKFKSTSRAPPPSGTPGSLRGNKECSPPPRAQAHTRGSRRRVRRQQYRAWKGG